MNQRQRNIVELLGSRGALSFRELAEQLDVATMTIRRDVEKLVEAGEAARTPGGVQRASVPSDFYETLLASRLDVAVAEKRAIAKVALATLSGGDTVYVDGGTTCIEFARQISAFQPSITVVTNSFLVCNELRLCRHHTVMAVGGEYDAEAFSTFGEMSESAVRDLHFDAAFLSTKGFVPTEGTYESSMGLLRLKQLVADQSGTVHVLIDHTKFGARSLCRVLSPDRIDVVITDEQIDQECLRATRAAGMAVQMAPSKELSNAT